MAAETLRIKLIHLQPDRAVLQRFDSGIVLAGDDQNTFNDSTVRCTLETVEFGAAPHYTALSYTWGDPKVRTPILIDGQSVRVTMNLEAALQHLRKGISEPLVLWVDAICINQDDEVEKSKQVTHMRDIYSKADSVITWLGDGGSSLAMRWVSEFGGRAAGLGIGATPNMLLKKVLERAEKQTQMDGGREECDPPTDEYIFANDLKRELSAELNTNYHELIAGLQDILKRPYWSRIWIVQEVTMAKKITFTCGKDTVAYDALHHALRLLRNFRLWQQLKLGRDATRPSCVREDSGLRSRVIDTNPSRPIDLLKISRAEGAMPMMYLLRRLQLFTATDSRDRVFALLGIATDARELEVKPDYSKSCEEVYTGLARILLRHGYFDVLSHCIHEPHDGTSSSLHMQTWVPDWSRKTTCSALQQRHLDRTRKPAVRTVLQPDFRASGSRRQPDRLEMSEQSWCAPLTVSGIIMGQVQLTGDRWEVGGIGKWLETLQALSRSPHSRLTDPHERSHAVLRTAVADQDIRRHNDKPRLTEDTLAKLDSTLTGMHLGLVDAQLLIDNELGHYAEELNSIGRGRRPFLSSDGSLAIGPEEAESGDTVGVILGAEVPYVLRRRTKGDGFIFIGEAYIDGCMDGRMAGPDAAVTEIKLF